MSKEFLTFEQIREQLRGTNYDSDDWVNECYSWVNSKGQTVKQWIEFMDMTEEDFKKLMNKDEFRNADSGTVLLNVDENGNVYTKS